MTRLQCEPSVVGEIRLRVAAMRRLATIAAAFVSVAGPMQAQNFEETVKFIFGDVRVIDASNCVIGSK
jgi:hypothetical protein